MLVTAGSTREMIDRVRDWGNIFTGNTGRSIAEAISQKRPVDLLTSNRAHIEDLRDSKVIRADYFSSHADLKKLLESKMESENYTAVFMTAAVADYIPDKTYRIIKRGSAESENQETWFVESVQAEKIKSTHGEIAVVGRPSEKLVDLFRSKWNFTGLLVKFKLEVGASDDELKLIGEKSRRASGADYLVANDLSMIDGDGAGAWLIGDHKCEWVPRDRLSFRMADLLHK